MAEQWLADPTSEGTGTQLDISTGAYTVTGFESPAPPLELSTSGTIDTEGDVPNARRHQNRQIQITVDVQGTSQANLDSNVATLEAKVAKFATQPDPLTGITGTFRRVRNDGTYRTADILAADQYSKAFEVKYFSAYNATATINLIGRPYVRGPEAQIGTTFSETSKAALVFNATGVGGEVEALGRLSITDAQAQAQYWATWARRSGTGATLYYEGELTTLGSGVTNSTYGGASNARVALATGATVTPGTKLCDLTASGVLSLTGTYRVFARVIVGSGYDPGNQGGAGGFASGGPNLGLALQWRALPNSLPTTNPVARAAFNAGTPVWSILDLGVVRFPVAALGTQASQASLIMQDSAGGTNGIGVDAVWFMPIDEGFGEATGNVSASLPAVYASKSLVIRHDLVLTQSGTSQYSVLPKYEGDYVRLMPGSSQVIVKASRVLPGTAGDVLDDINATLFVTPRYLSFN